MGRTIMQDAQVPDPFWTYAVKFAGHIYNRLPSQRLNWKTPYEVASGQPPNISHMRIPFCKCWMRNHNATGSILSKKGIEGIFFGYTQDANPTSTGHTYLFYNPETHTVTPTTNLTFDESVMPFRDMGRTTTYMNRRCCGISKTFIQGVLF